MNSNEIYSSYAKQLNINFENIKAKIKDNEIERLGLMITELRDLRKEYITAFSRDTSIGNRYRGQILSSSRGSSMTIDLEKSIEYEAILLSILSILNDKPKLFSIIPSKTTTINSIITNSLSGLYNYYSPKKQEDKDKIINDLKIQLEDKDKIINETNKCSICLDNIISNCCIPCGHTYCTSCINKTNNCYICRTIIKNKIKIYL
jgi:hypothetical protein